MQAAKTVFPAVATKGCYFHFCQALQEQACVDVKLAQAAAGARAPPQSRWTVEKNRRIWELKTQFTANTLCLDAYIRGLAGLTNLRV